MSKLVYEDYHADERLARAMIAAPDRLLLVRPPVRRG